MAAKNSINEYGETVLTTNDAIRAIYTGADVNFAIVSDDVERTLFNDNAEQVLHTPAQLNIATSDIPLDEYYHKKQDTWFIPDKYKVIDIENYVVAKCTTQCEVDRVLSELALYKQMDLEDVLRFLIFLIDHLREHKIVWGVGRGSSVASYVLYLIGVHKINSLKYDLDITEFLK